MTVEYSRRAVADLEQIANYYLAEAGPVVAMRFQSRLLAIVSRIERRPQSGRAVLGRNDVRIVPMLSFPYNVFYRQLGADRIRVLHVRHMSRQPAVRTSK